jgi:hypothetical protein
MQVMRRILIVEGKQMDDLIGLSWGIFNALSKHAEPVLELFQYTEAFAAKSVESLNAHMKPTPVESSDIWTLLLGLIVYVVELCPRYIAIFIGWEGKYSMILGQTLGNASNLYNFLKRILQWRDGGGGASWTLM